MTSRTFGGQASRAALTPLRFFVAANGNDGWSGTRPRPNRERTDGPFATLERARDAAREAKARTDGGIARVVVRGGRYFLKSALALDARDSGLRIEAAAGEKVTLSGGRMIGTWTPYRDRIMQADISGLALHQDGFRELYYNGRRQPLARVPNFDPQQPRTGGFAYNAEIVEKDSATKFRYKPHEIDPRKWAHLELALVDFFAWWNYSNTVSPIKQVDTAAQVLEVTRGGYALQPDDRFYVMSVFEELDAPGEWYADYEKMVLYFWPPDERWSDSEVIVPALDSLIVLQGGAEGDSAVHGVTLRRLVMQDCRGAAVSITGARDCTVAAGAFRNVGSAVHLGDDTHYCRVLGCDITQTGGAGIDVAGVPDHPEGVTHHRIDNNYIYDFGWSTRSVGGVQVCGAAHCVISHNHIHDGPRCGIMQNCGHDNVFSYNHLHHLNLETCDTGAIYTVTNLGGWNHWMVVENNLRIRGHQIHHNLIHDTGGYGKVEPGVWESPHYCWGIYLDAASSGYHVHDNVVYNTDFGAFMIGGGQDNLCENNVFVEGRQQQLYVIAWLDPTNLCFPMARNRIERNVIACSRPGVRLYQFANVQDDWARLARNVVSLPQTPTVQVEWAKDLSWEEWQARGQDAGSLIADPLFVDPAHRDYRLRPESPAFGVGSTPIDITTVGNYRSPHRYTWPRPEVAVFREAPVTRSSYEAPAPSK